MFKNFFKQKDKVQKIYAPLNGEIVKIQDVPDPVFSEKMMGEGIAILPNEGEVFSPVDGKVVQIPDTKHAIGLEAEDGTEILVHIGLETVGLQGQGFTVHVNTGDSVSVGQSLMEVDLDYITNNASSTITPIVLTNSGNSEKTYTMTEEKEAIAGETVIITAADK